VSLAGTELASAPVSFVLSATPFDEQGTASLTFTIPEGVSGDLSLTVTGPGGTEVDIPISIAVPVETSVQAWPKHYVVGHGAGAKINVVVNADDGSAPLGVVTLSEGGTVIGTVTLTEADAGRAKFSTGKISRGFHVYTVDFAGDGVYQDSQAKTGVLAH
jgi:5'-nucleotidase